MNYPDAVLKHDGRRVAFDAAWLELSVVRAARGAREALTEDAAARLSRQVAEDVCEAALAGGKSVVASADLRALTVAALRTLQFDGVADAYQEHARAASQLLWRVRVVEPERPRNETAGVPWDRRRLLESLRASGVPFDMAGAVARGVERSIVTLGAEFVSPALIHALAVLELPAIHGARAYGVRRVAYSATEHVPHWNAKAAADNPLPVGGAALEAFWLQSVHSPDVVKAVRENFMSLDPYPASPSAFVENHSDLPLDPLGADFSAALSRCFSGGSAVLNVRVDGPKRLDAMAERLAGTAAESGGIPQPGVELKLYFKAVPKRLFGTAPRAGPVTLNAGGLVAREGLRDVKRAAARLAELAGLAVQAHREREEYFLLSPVRGRILPIAAAGLWNATAWLQGEGFDATRAAVGARQAIAPLCRALRAAVEQLRDDSGMELVLTAAAPLNAERRLWRADRGFFLRDGMELDKASAYESAPEMKLSPAMDDFINRLDFAKAVGAAFDEPPELSIEAPLSSETSASNWAELLTGLSRAGVACLRLSFGGGARTIPNLARAVHDYLIGFPLLDSLDDEKK